MTMISAEISAYLMGGHIRDSKVRVLMFLLSCTGPVSTADISQAVGISPKAVNRSIKKLTGAGIIQPGEPEPRSRTFTVPGVDREGSQEEQPDPSFVDRLDRIEAALGRLMDTKGAGRDARDTGSPAAVPEGIISGRTGDQKTTPQKPEPDPPITHAHASNISLLASSLKEANNSSLQEFKDLFGVSAPDDADHSAVAEMVRRRKAGKLADIKNPLGYLRSLAGKVTAAEPATGKPEGGPPHVPPVIDQKQIDLENAIRQKWFDMTDIDREPYRQRARITHTGAGTFKVPIELLARAQFNREQMAACGR